MIEEKHIPGTYIDKGRRRIHINYRQTNYARWLIEQHLGRKLEKWEHVHHIDGNKLNDDISNLKLIHETLHHMLHKSKPSGIRTRSKLTVEKVIEIKKLLAAGNIQTDIAKQYNVAGTTINAIATGRNWSTVKGEANE